MNAIRSTTLPLAVAALLLWPSSSSAQIRMPGGSPLPPLDDLIVLRKTGTTEELRIRVAYEGLKPRELPGPASPDNPDANGPIEFLKAFRAVKQDRGPDGQSYYLLAEVYSNGTRVREVIGWVDERYLVIGTQALKHPLTKLLKKAMIINSLENIREDVERVTNDPDARFGTVAPRLGPSPEARTNGEDIRLFNVFFVFGETQDHVLIGRRPEFIPGDPDDPARVILGWVPKVRVRTWLTREALFWKQDDPKAYTHCARGGSCVGEAAKVIRHQDAPNANMHRMTSGIVYATAKDALNGQYGPDEATRRQARTVTVEEPMPGGVFGRPLLYSQMRFPLFGNERDPGDRVSRQFQDNEILRIGAFSGFVSGAADRVIQRLSEKELRDFQIALTVLQNEMRQVEVLFVVDETGSMANWFDLVAQTIERLMIPILNRGVRGAGRDIRLGVSYYGTNFAGANPFTAAPLQKTPDLAAVRRIAEQVRSHQPRDGGPNDALARVFLGLGRGIDAARFSRMSRKLVVLVGDTGNKTIEGDPTIEELINKMVPPDPGKTPIEFYAVQVGDAKFIEEHIETLQFRSEMRAMTTRVSQGIQVKHPADPSAGRLSSFNSVNWPRDTDEFINPIVERITVMRKLAQKISDDIDGLRLTFGNQISPATEQGLIANGVPIDRLRQIRGAQVFQDGYVWRKNAQHLNQVREYLLLNGGELEEFIRLMSGLDRPAGAVGRITIEDFIRNLVQAMGGELNFKDRSKTLNDLLQQATGLTLTSPMFNRVIADIRNASLNDQEMADIRWKQLILKDIFEAKRHVFVEQPNQDGGGTWIEHVPSDAPAEYEPRGFYAAGDDSIKWYWIDLKSEWP
jgi:hypothetical protein